MLATDLLGRFSGSTAALQASAGPKLFSWACVGGRWLLGAWLVAATTRGDPWATQPVGEAGSDGRALAATVRDEASPGTIPIRRAYLSAGTNRFAFTVPDGFQVAMTTGNRVELLNRERSCQITLALLPPALLGGETAAGGQNLRARLADRFPAAEIIEEFFLAAAGHSGPAFDLHWRSEGVTRAARLAYVPLAAGLFEFGLVTSPANFTDFQPVLHTVMLSFRASGPDGELDLPALSEKL